MESDFQSTDTDTASAGPESSAPVNESRSAAPSATLSDEKMSASMSAAYDRAEARGSSEQPATSDQQNERTQRISTPTEIPPLPASLNGRINQATWAGLPQEARELVMQREQEAQTKISQQGHELAELKRSGGMAGELASVLEHFTPNLPPHIAEMPRVQQIAALYAASEALDRDPVGSIQKLAAQYGLDLSQLGGNSGSAEHQQALWQYQQAYQQLHAQHQHWHQQRMQYLEQQILEYVQDKPHSPEIEDEWMRQIAAVKATNPRLFEADPLAVLKQAEQRALAIVPGADKSKAVEAKKRADEAKRLGSLNLKTGGMSRSPMNTSRDIWSNDGWGAVYDKAQRR
jgi:hypothetical protein